MFRHESVHDDTLNTVRGHFSYTWMTDIYLGNEANILISFVYFRWYFIKDLGGCRSSIFFIDTTNMSKVYAYTPSVDLVASTFLITCFSTSTKCTCRTLLLFKHSHVFFFPFTNLFPFSYYQSNSVYHLIFLE